jgi:hypothetical protein
MIATSLDEGDVKRGSGSNMVVGEVNASETGKKALMNQGLPQGIRTEGRNISV